MGHEQISIKFFEGNQRQFEEWSYHFTKKSIPNPLLEKFGKLKSINPYSLGDEKEKHENTRVLTGLIMDEISKLEARINFELQNICLRVCNENLK